MKYPITPTFLENVPNYIVSLQRDLEDDVIRDICRRFESSGELTESAIHQIVSLRNRGIDMSHIEKRVKEISHLTDSGMEEAFDRAIARNQEYYDDLIKKSDITKPQFSLENAERQFDTLRRQTKGELRNITQSMGFMVNRNGGKTFLPIAKAYQKILDNAYMKVSSGAFDYNTAISGAVRELSASGLQYVDYASGWHNRIDVAARRAVMTGIGQVSAQYSAQTMAELGTDLVEVTAHSGARDKGSGFINHKAWQGKVYSFSGKNKHYPSLVTVCGYGMGGGIAGWNCRHSYYAFIEGVSKRAYKDGELRAIDKPPFSYDGREYSAYEATQQQRKLEAAMRDVKRDLIGQEAAGQPRAYQNSAIRLQKLRREYASFSEAAGLRMQPKRAQINEKR